MNVLSSVVVFSRVQDGETIEQYATALRTLCQTCNFCSFLQDLLLRDRIVTGVRDELEREKLLPEQNLTLAQALDICRSNEAPPSS